MSNKINIEQLKERAAQLKTLADEIKNLACDTKFACSNFNLSHTLNEEEFNKEIYLREYLKGFCEEMEISSLKSHLNNALLYKSFVMYTKFNKPKVSEITYHDFERLATSYM